MNSCVIVDDEKPAREALAMMVSTYLPEKVKIVGLAGSVKEGVFLIFEQKQDLINLNYIKTYSRTEGFHVILENGMKLNVATRRNEDFLKVLTKKQ